jgi:phosphoglycolate phosphatase
MNNEFNLIVFDWDGTLMDSEARIVACVRAAIRDLELPLLDDHAISNIIGLGLREAIDTLYPGSDEQLHRNMVDRYRYHFLTANPTPSEMFEGAREVLESLADEGYLLAVATGKGRVGLDKVLHETGLGELFHGTRCSDETFSKPHPQMLLELMDELGVESHETLMIGDTEYDLQMAKNAGTRALGVSYGVHAIERLHQHEPLDILDSIGELPGWLEQSNHEQQVLG